MGAAHQVVADLGVAGLIERIGERPNELYDLKTDPEERTNLCDDRVHRAIQEKLRRRLYAFFDRHADPKWDLWNGGGAKGGLLLGKAPYEEVGAGDANE